MKGLVSKKNYVRIVRRGGMHKYKCTSGDERHWALYITAQKMKFSINDFSSKCDQIRRADLATFTGEILNGKLHFLCSVHDHRKAY